MKRSYVQPACFILVALWAGAGCTDGAQPTGEVTEIICDQQAVPIDANQTYSWLMHQTADPYPARCQYYTIDAPAGSSELAVQIADMTADLDVTVQYGACFFRNAWESDSDTWFSNQEGTLDEVVSIPAPQAGPYFVEVCSYDGTGTPYTMTIVLR